MILGYLSSVPCTIFFVTYYIFVKKNQKKLQSLIEAEENANQAERNPEEQRRHSEFQSRMDIDDSDIIVTGANTTRISRKQVFNRVKK